MSRRERGSLRVAVEATAACTPQRSGIARVVVQLVDELATRPDVDLTVLYRLSRIRRYRLCHRPAGVRRAWLQEPFLPLPPRAPLVHGLDARVPAWERALRVATVHDCFAFLTDEFASASFVAMKQERHRALARTCDHIVCVSEATRRDFVHHVGYPAERTSVIHLAADERFDPSAARGLPALRAKLGLPERYLLYVGQLTARKNVPRLLEAYANTAVARELPLVLAGPRTYRHEEVDATLARLGLADRVVLTGFVDDADLPALYAGATALCFATLYEGFGLPILEALRSGTAVLASDVGAAPEIAGGHATLVDPTDVGSIAAGLDAVVATPPAAREAGVRHARAFSWKRCADRHVELWRALLAAGGAPPAPIDGARADDRAPRSVERARAGS